MNARIWMLPQGVLVLVFLLHAAAALNGSPYDWDIDHMMYFGGRLLQGELVWTREFDDKLPLVQVLFAVPAAAGSVKAWQLMSIVSVVLAALGLWWALQRVLARDWGLAPRVARHIALSGSALYLFLAAVLPGSLSHINPMAASLLTLATLLLLARRRGRGNLFSGVPGTLLAPACLASVAISMRPYLLAPALLAGAWAVTRHAIEEPARPSRLAMSAELALWVATLGAAGLALNAVPYVAAGETASFRDGLSMLGQQLNPQSLPANAGLQARALYFGNDLTVFVVLAWLAFAGWLLVDAVRQRSGLLHPPVVRVDVLFAVVLSPLALQLMILSKHFWPHYQQLFIPYAAAAVAFMFALAARARARGVRVPDGVAGMLLLGAFLVAVRTDLSRSALDLLRPPAMAHQWEPERSAFGRFLAQHGTAGGSFLHPSHMYLHWTMGQPRHGFPHAANTRHIAQGWWSKVRRPAGMELPLTREEYCRQLERHGPRFVLDRPDYWVMSCFTRNPASHYRQAALLEIAPGTQLAVFERVR